ncbi:MAG TPA: isoleucine--tRNA ligase [Streptosporangiaceae bacterium]
MPREFGSKAGDLGLPGLGDEALTSGFRAARGLVANPDLPALEHEVLRRWRAGRVFERSLEQTSGGPRWIFYEGPPTANGMPGAHHIEARVLKDAFPRFKTMQGFHVPRRAGWDCHGLPVEVAVEQELRLGSKREIETYGIAAFNARCRESVLRHVAAFTEFSERMGYWTDISAAYKTMDPDYIESVWWSLKQIYDRGLLVRDFRISPYCPRCGTPLSDHELGQDDVYRTVADPSVIVRLPILALPPALLETAAGPERATVLRQLASADLLVWTTTPWTLVSNTAVAVHPDETYALARKSGSGELAVVADALLGRVLGEGWHVIEQFTGAELAGTTYQPPFNLIEIPGPPRVVTGSFVTTQDGTGLVHLAPAFGADDMAAGRQHGLPIVNPVQPDGRFGDQVPMVGGMFFKAADQRLITDLADRGLLFASHLHEHSYPHCWRCGTPLLYYALPSWFIATTQVAGEMLAANEQTNWQPPTLKHGRYGDWLRNNVDWALSRTRYWGTPLPIWVCAEDHITCVGSLAELSQLAGTDLRGIDPHRPYVDEVQITCPSCARPAQRVPEVIDVWYDSGSMPFAQFGAPLRNEAEFRQSYPAQFICEAIDQTRGWFYSLMAIGVLVFGQSAYQNVVALGLITDEHGRRMSKHLGNVLEPIQLMDTHSADAVRWFFAASGSPWSARRIGPAALAEIVRKVLLTYWHTVSFLVLYASTASGEGQRGEVPGEEASRLAAEGLAAQGVAAQGVAAQGVAAQGAPRDTAPGPGLSRGMDLSLAPAPASRPVLDRWLLSELSLLIRDVTAAFEDFDPAVAGRRLASFIDDLSNWYVRRSRRRFWDGPGTPDGAAAFATLATVLETLTRLMAPLTPFITDYVWPLLSPPDAPDSVHLASWPIADESLIDTGLAAQMAQVRRLVELGRSARASAVVKVRQPLARALIAAPGFVAMSEALRAQIAEELNVREIETLDTSGAELVSYLVRPNFRALGRRFGNATQPVAAAIAAADPAALAASLHQAGEASLEVAGEQIAIGSDDVIVTQIPVRGWAVATEGAETIALEVTITPELRREGLAREFIRLVQEARKNDGLDVTDRIALRWSAADPELSAALAEHKRLISAEVLAAELDPAPDPGIGGDTNGASGGGRHESPDLGLVFWVQRI